MNRTALANTRPTILITSVGSGVGYAVLHALRASPRNYRLIGANAMTIAAGNFRCDATYHLPLAIQEQAYLERLSTIVDLERPEMIIPGHDMELPVLARHRAQLEATYATRVLVSPPEVVEICNDKLASARFFGSHFVETACTPEEIAALYDRCGFPLVVKPRQGYASRGVSVVFSEAELAAALTPGESWIVQDFLAPCAWGKQKSHLTRSDVFEQHRLRQEDEYSVQVFVGRQGDILGIFSSRNTLWHGIPMTIETCHDRELKADVLAMTRRLVALGLIGPCNFQARRQADGRHVFFEVNARFTGITGVRADMGFNECDAAYRHFVEGETTPALVCPAGLLAQRYMTHDIFSSQDARQLDQSGRWHAST